MYRYFLACITCSRLESPLCGYDDLRFIFKACLIHSRQLRSFQNQLLVFCHRPRKSVLNLSVCFTQSLVSSKISTFSKLLIRLSFLFSLLISDPNAMKTAAESLRSPVPGLVRLTCCYHENIRLPYVTAKTISAFETHDASSSNS